MHNSNQTPRPVGHRPGANLKAICCTVAATLIMSHGVRAGVRSILIPTRDSEPISIVQGTDGNLWFTQQSASSVARVSPDGVITEFPTPTLSFPNDITLGPDGNIWFSEGAAGQIAFITPAGVIKEIFFSSSGVGGGIATGSDGNIWFTDLTGNSVWRFDLATRNLTSFLLPTANAFPGDITLGADGNLWFVEGGVGKIGRITPSGVITEFGNGLSLPYSIALGPDGNVWFTLRFSAQLGSITPAGVITFYPIPNSAEQIAPGLRDSLIFTEFGKNKIARITVDGVVTEAPEIPGSNPTGITIGPDNKIWFLGYGSDRVYRASFSR